MSSPKTLSQKKMKYISASLSTWKISSLEIIANTSSQSMTTALALKVQWRRVGIYNWIKHRIKEMRMTIQGRNKRVYLMIKV
jgi:hypothetical protein